MVNRTIKTEGRLSATKIELMNSVSFGYLSMVTFTFCLQVLNEYPSLLISQEIVSSLMAKARLVIKVRW